MRGSYRHGQVVATDWDAAVAIRGYYKPIYCHCPHCEGCTQEFVPYDDGVVRWRPLKPIVDMSEVKKLENDKKAFFTYLRDLN